MEAGKEVKDGDGRAVQEKSPREVEREFGLKDRSLESLRDRASGFAGMVAAFCQRMKFTQLELLIAKFQVHYVCAKLADAADTVNLRASLPQTLDMNFAVSIEFIKTTHKAAVRSQAKMKGQASIVLRQSEQ